MKSAPKKAITKTTNPEVLAPNHHRQRVPIWALVILGLLIATIIFFTLQFVFRIGIFHVGTLAFDESVTAATRDFVANAVDGIELDDDVTVSAGQTYTAPTDSHTLTFDILVPVTDFYNPLLEISTEQLTSLAAGQNIDGVDLLSIWNLKPEFRLLSVDENYYLDTLNSGAIFNTVTISGHDADVEKITAILSNTLQSMPTSEEILTLAQTGVTALSRRMNSALLTGDPANVAAGFAQYIGPYLSSFDLTHTSNEASFSNSASINNICSNPVMINTLTAIGLDIVELTGNHNQDCGDKDAIATIDLYAAQGIKTFGGGKTATLAAEALNIDQKGTELTLLGYNLSTGGYTLDDTPGANFYTEKQAAADISNAKENGRQVIVDIQYYECNEYDNANDSRVCDYANSSAGDQITFFRHLIDLGANVVVGTSAHQPQTFELYGNGAIYYGLGNLFFDQSFWPGTTRSLILVHYFYNNQLIQTRIVPTVYDSTYQTKLMEIDDASAFLERLISARP